MGLWKALKPGGAREARVHARELQGQAVTEMLAHEGAVEFRDKVFDLVGAGSRELDVYSVAQSIGLDSAAAVPGVTALATAGAIVVDRESWPVCDRCNGLASETLSQILKHTDKQAPHASATCSQCGQSFVVSVARMSMKFRPTPALLQRLGLSA